MNRRGFLKFAALAPIAAIAASKTSKIADASSELHEEQFEVPVTAVFEHTDCTMSECEIITTSASDDWPLYLTPLANGPPPSLWVDGNIHLKGKFFVEDDEGNVTRVI